MTRNEYDLPKLHGTVSMTKLRNALRKINPDLVIDLSNNRINGQLQGCSGFITNPDTDKIAYVNADASRGRGHEALYRTAASPRDYAGGLNHFTDNAALPQALVDLVS